MPTYWYRCQTCKHEFEEFQKITDPPVKTCPECGGVVMRVITGGVGLIFKGTGFYITDYKRAHSSEAAGPGKSNSESHSESKSSESSSKSEGSSSSSADKKGAASGGE